MNLITVTDKKTEKMFLDTARIINKNDKTWVCPLDGDIKGVFDPRKNTKPVLDEEFIWLAYFEGRPIAIYLMFPDLNQILKHLNGKLDPISLLRFVWFKNRKTEFKRYPIPDAI